MSTTYTGLGTEMNVRALGTTRTVGFTTDVALVGSASAEGDATQGEVYLPTDFSDAADAFGEDSELFYNYRMAKANGAGDVWCAPIEVFEATETTNGPLMEAPLDPQVTDYDIVVDNGDIDVIVSYDDNVAPSEGEAVVKPADQTIEFADDLEHDVEYSYGDYSVVEDAVDLNIRGVGVLTEESSVINEVLSVVRNAATDFDFLRAFVGATPHIDVTEIADYNPAVQDQRVVETTPNRGHIDSNQQLRTVGAVLGLAAGKPLGDSITYETLNGFESFDYGYKPSQAANFNQVTAIASTMEITEGVTTSDTNAFSDIYKCEIIDTVAQGIQFIAKDFAGNPNTETDRDDFESNIRQLLNGYTGRSPPLLYSTSGDTEPFDTDVEVGSTDEEVILHTSIDPLDIVKTVIIDINVGTVVTYEGARVAEEDF